MNASTLSHRYDDFIQRAGHPHSRFELQHHGDAVVCRTGRRHVRTWRLLLTLGGAAAVAAGSATLAYTAVAYGLIGLGVSTATLTPLLVRPKRLLEIDPETGTLTAAALRSGGHSALPLDAIVSVEGIYEITGWEGRSVVHAILTDGTRVPLVSFTGTDEALACYACQAVGTLLDRPATYTGAFDGPVLCYASERMGSVPA